MLSKRLSLVAAIVVLLSLLVYSLWPQTSVMPAMTHDRRDVDQRLSRSGAFSPLPPVPAVSADKVALGKALFSDVRLSRDNSLSCAGCHDLSSAGHDGRRVAVGVGGAQGSINTPTVFNSSMNAMQFWDGRVTSLEEQVSGPIHNPVEMASNWDEVIGKLKSDSSLLMQFRRVYPDGLTATNIEDAIAAFERTLLTADSPFDRFLEGQDGAIDAPAKRGYRKFLELGCAACHQGVNIGGNMFQRFGIMGNYFADRAEPITKADLGRFNVTGQEVDRHVFKVPSLRNVAQTAPYFHDGSVATLEEAVTVMGRYQLGRQLTDEEVAALVSFLKALSGRRPTILLSGAHG